LHGSFGPCGGIGIATGGITHRLIAQVIVRLYLVGRKYALIC